MTGLQMAAKLSQSIHSCGEKMGFIDENSRNSSENQAGDVGEAELLGAGEALLEEHHEPLVDPAEVRRWVIL